MANSALNAHATHHQLWSGMRVWPCLQTAPEVVLWSPPWHMITTWASPWRPSPFEKGWQEGVEVTSRSGASGSTTLYLLHTDGGGLRHNCKHIRMHPVHVQQPASSQTPLTYGQHQSTSILQSTASCNSWPPHQTWFCISRTAITHRVLYSLWSGNPPSSKILGVAVLLPNHQVLISTVLNMYV